MSIGRTSVAAGAVSVVFILMLPEVSVGDLVLAALAGGAAVALGQTRRLPERAAILEPARYRIWRLVQLISLVVANAARGSWQIALVALGAKRLPAPGIVEIEIGDRSRRGTAVTGLLVTISPGTVLLDIDEERGVLLFHVVGSDVAEFRRSVDRLYATQRHLIP